MGAQRLNKAAYLSNGTMIAGNTMYEIVIEDGLGEGVGLYTVRTGSEHPITKQAERMRKENPKQDLLGGGNLGQPGTSYTTIRSYSSKTDYVQSQFAASGPEFSTVWLDSTFIGKDSVVVQSVFIKPIPNNVNPTGYRVTYNAPGLATIPQKQPGAIPDTMEITQIINVHGSLFADSWVEATTMVTNRSSRSVDIGIRYFLDLAVSGDDGPMLVQKTFNHAFGNTETSITRFDFAFYEAAANDTLVLPFQDYRVLGSALTPATLLRSPVQPERMQQVSWLLAFLESFDYEIDPGRDVTTQADPIAGRFGGDSAIQYFWGAAPETKITLLPDSSISVTQALLAALPGQEPAIDLLDPRCLLAAVDLGPPKRFELVVQDPESGLRSVQVKDDFNVRFEVPSFQVGTLEPERIVGTAIDPAQPFGFILEVTDLSGRSVACDPIFLTLIPDLRIFEYRVEPLFSDRYFYIKNQGIRRIVANLNGHEFTLSADPLDGGQLGNIFAMPAYGEMTIDMVHYMQEDANTMTIAFDGPEGSRADLVLSDMTMKGNVDFILNLTPLPKQFAMSQNMPNPFHSATTIHFEVPAFESDAAEAGRVELKIYNMLGQLVRTLVDADLPFGSYRREWDGRDEAGRAVAAGVYLYSLNASGKHITKKMALIR